MGVQENKDLVREFFERFAAGDPDGATALLADDVVWRVMGREGGLPVSGEMDRAGIAALIVGVREAIPDGLDLTPTGWTAEGDRVALEMESYGMMASGEVYNNLYHFLITINDGTVASLREYMDTDQARRLFLSE